MGPNSFQWCLVTGQGAMGTNWGIGSSVWTWGRTSSLWGWRSPGTGCPGRLWSLLLWRYSRPAWTRSCAACCRWPRFGRGFGLDDPQRSLPTPTILWFCDSVILRTGKKNSNMLRTSQLKFQMHPQSFSRSAGNAARDGVRGEAAAPRPGKGRAWWQRGHSRQRVAVRPAPSETPRGACARQSPLGLRAIPSHLKQQ